MEEETEGEKLVHRGPSGPSKELKPILSLWEATECFVCLFVCCCLLFRATLAALGGARARGQIGATAAGLCHSHSNARSKLCLQPTPQLTAMPDP